MREDAKLKRDRVLLFFIIIFVICSILLGAVLVYFKYIKGNTEGGPSFFSGNNDNSAANEALIDGAIEVFANTDVNQEQLNELADVCKENPTAIPVLQHFSAYPDRVIKMILLDTDTIDFVLNYLDKVDVEVDENIDISGDYVEGKVPLFIQWDDRWGYYSYGNGVAGYTACGPTCISMVYTYLTGDLSMNPLAMAKFCKERDYLEKGVGTKWTLYTEGANALGMNSKTLTLDENEVAGELQSGNPVICSVGPGDFTDTGHFIVITSYNNGKVTVNDPNSYKNSKKEWELKKVLEQAKGAWSFWK